MGRFALLAFVALVAVVVAVVTHGDKRTRHTVTGPSPAASHKTVVLSVDSTIGSSNSCPQPTKHFNEMTPEQIDRWILSCLKYMEKHRSKATSSG